jgi:hypothetical protein
VLVHRQFEPPVQIRSQTRFDALACAFAPDQNQRIVGVSREAMSSAFQFPVQIVEQNVGQQRRELAMDTKGNLYPTLSF